VIDVTWGGTPAEAWTSLDALSSDASLMPVFARRAKLMDVQVSAELQQAKEKQDYDAAKAEGKSATPPRWHATPESWRPAGLFNAMIAPLTPFAIKGVIWYQAESNGDADGVPLYGRLFKTLIQDWRNQWGEGDFPFLFVQVANYNPGLLWPELREGQRSALALRKTAMAVTIDIGDPDNIHPKDKQDVGLRLSLAARALAYGEAIEYSGPLVRQVTVEGSSLRVEFDHAKEGLVSKNGDLRTFEIAGADNNFIPAQARIDGDVVLVSNPALKNPVYVRYGWAPNPNCNLYNHEGLPASPFLASAYHTKDPQ
jgi:sialate O-acetylesterase